MPEAGLRAVAGATRMGREPHTLPVIVLRACKNKYRHVSILHDIHPMNILLAP